MKAAAKSKPSSRKVAQKRGRKPASGQPIKNDRYIYLTVDNTPEMAKALNRLNSNSDTQKEAVQSAILKAAGRM